MPKLSISSIHVNLISRNHCCGNGDGPIPPHFRAALLQLSCQRSSGAHLSSATTAGGIPSLPSHCLCKEKPARNRSLPRKSSPWHQSSLQGRGRGVQVEARQVSPPSPPAFSGLFGHLSCSCKCSISSSTWLIFNLTLYLSVSFSIMYIERVRGF